MRIPWDPFYFWSIERAIKTINLEEALLRQGHFKDFAAQVRSVLAMGPDKHTKYNYSGGGPIGVRVPDASMDGVFETDDYHGQFVGYLRLCFRYAGLPGLSDLAKWIREHNLPARVEQIERDMRHLTEDLLPF